MGNYLYPIVKHSHVHVATQARAVAPKVSTGFGERAHLQPLAAFRGQLQEGLPTILEAVAHHVDVPVLLVNPAHEEFEGHAEAVVDAAREALLALVACFPDRLLALVLRGCEAMPVDMRVSMLACILPAAQDVELDKGMPSELLVLCEQCRPDHPPACWVQPKQRLMVQIAREKEQVKGAPPEVVERLKAEHIKQLRAFNTHVRFDLLREVGLHLLAAIASLRATVAIQTDAQRFREHMTHASGIVTGSEGWVSEPCFEAGCLVVEAIFGNPMIELTLGAGVLDQLMGTCCSAIANIAVGGQHFEQAGAMLQSLAKAGLPWPIVEPLLVLALNELQRLWRRPPFSEEAQEQASRACVLMEVARCLLERAGWWFVMWTPNKAPISLCIKVSEALDSLLLDQSSGFMQWDTTLLRLDLGGLGPMDSEVFLRGLSLFTPYVARVENRRLVPIYGPLLNMAMIKAVQPSALNGDLFKASLRAITLLAVAGAFQPDNAKQALSCLKMMSDMDLYKTDHTHLLYYDTYRLDYLRAVVAMEHVHNLYESDQVPKEMKVFVRNTAAAHRGLLDDAQGHDAAQVMDVVDMLDD